MLQLLKLEEEGAGEEEVEEEAVGVVEEYQYRRGRYFLLAEKKSRRHRGKARIQKELVLLPVQAEIEETQKSAMEKAAETQWIQVPRKWSVN